MKVLVIRNEVDVSAATVRERLERLGAANVCQAALSSLKSSRRRVDVVAEAVCELAQCRNLGLLQLHRLRLRAQFPRELCETLTTLKELEVVRCETLRRLPSQFVRLTSLQYLAITRCGLVALPSNLGQLKCLRDVDFRNNPNLPPQFATKECNLLELYFRKCEEHFSVEEAVYARMMEVLMIRWFRESPLSVLPKDVVRIICKHIWEARSTANSKKKKQADEEDEEAKNEKIWKRYNRK